MNFFFRTTVLKHLVKSWLKGTCDRLIINRGEKNKNPTPSKMSHLEFDWIIRPNKMINYCNMTSNPPPPSLSPLSTLHQSLKDPNIEYIWGACWALQNYVHMEICSGCAAKEEQKIVPPWRECSNIPLWVAPHSLWFHVQKETRNVIPSSDLHHVM